MKRLLGWGFPRGLLSCPAWALPPGKRRPLGRGRVRGGLAAPARAGARGCATCYLLGLGLLHLHQEKGLHEATADGALQPLDVARVGVIEHLPLHHRRLRLVDVSPGDTVGSRVPMENAAEGVRTERTESVLSGQAREVVSRRRLCLEVCPMLCPAASIRSSVLPPQPSTLAAAAPTSALEPPSCSVEHPSPAAGGSREGPGPSAQGEATARASCCSTVLRGRSWQSSPAACLASCSSPSCG